jgi:hypothetical protein
MFLRTKIREVIAHLRSPKKSGRRSAAIGVKLLKKKKQNPRQQQTLQNPWQNTSKYLHTPSHCNVPLRS